MTIKYKKSRNTGRWPSTERDSFSQVALRPFTNEDLATISLCLEKCTEGK